jgi:hypothetical protein
MVSDEREVAALPEGLVRIDYPSSRLDIDRHNRRNALVRATDRGQVRIALPSFPLCKIRSPPGRRPVMMPT